MSKDLTKLFTELRDEMKTEWKLMREALERDFRSEIRDLRTDIREMKSSMDFINAQYEDIKEKLESGITINKELKKENEELRARCLALETEMRANQASIVRCEQHSRAYNIEVKGIPVAENENLISTLRKLGEVIGEPIDESDVGICHRVRTRERGKQNIIVQFIRREKRDRVLASARVKRLTNEDLGLSDNAPVFVNEHLCPALKKLLGQAISRKRDIGWKFVWVQNGKILARKAEHAHIISIEHCDDLLKIC